MNDHDLIKRLLDQDEGPILDYKSESIRLDSDYYKAAFIKDLICMANTPREGCSYIVFGIVSKPDGTKEIVGVSKHPDDANLQTLIKSRVQPIPKFHYRPISYQGKSLGILEVHPRRGGPFTPSWGYKKILRPDVVYFRRGSSNDEAKAEDHREIAKWMDSTNREDIEDIEDIIEERLDSRKISIAIGGASLPLPNFFPSISSVKANLEPVEYLRVLKGVDHPLFLISAYDIHNCRNKHDLNSIKVILRESVKNEKAVILDSGNYESYWQKDKTWTKADFGKCLDEYDYGFAFYFDKREQKYTHSSAQLIINEIERGVLKDQEKTNRGTIIPIVHAPENLIPEVSCGVVDRLTPVMIAMPERELGGGIASRAETIWKTRQSLNKKGEYYPIHLLGTGNPLSILIYVLCGADSFDGVEWFQSTIDYKTALIYHFQQREFFGPQSKFCSMPELPYDQATLAHNLLFYQRWMGQIRSGIISGNIAEFANRYLPNPFKAILNKQLPKVL